jgi:phenylpyruvate tautomerase PptA (4-oxalocrotonate tautomerase family)
MVEYLRTIIYFLVFAAVAGMLAPSGRYRKFTALVTGLILLAVMVAPLGRMGHDVPITEWFVGLLPGQVYTWDANAPPAHDAHLRHAFETQLHAQLSGFLAREGVSVQFAEFEYSPDFMQITKIYVSVTPAAGRAEPRQPFIRIEPIRWRDRQEQEEECALANEVRALISQFYQMEPANIHVTVQEGTP